MKNKSCKNTAIDATVVPTTHWDRDWFWSFERFRVKLIEMFSTLEKIWKENPDYIFTMDGQSIAVEDYLQVLPDKAELLKEMGKRGLFKMGPLYVLSDVWLTGAEAFIRNLLIGRSMSDKFDAVQDSVYQPDTFGFHPDLPTLISGARLDTFIAMRGAPVDLIGDQRFFIWEGPDGEQVQVYRLRDGYANAAALGRTFGTGEIMDAKSSGIPPAFSMKDAIKKLSDATDELRDGHGAPHLLLAGVDHQIPQTELPDILENCRTATTEYHYGTLDDIAEDMRNHPQRDRWKVHRGELHDSSASQLGGTISSRIYLKQANSAVERLLTRTIEPAAAALAALGIDEPADAIIEQAWKYLMTAHPHDDITGCSVDAVHQENELMIEKARQAADALERRLARDLIHHYGGQKAGDNRIGFILFNTDGTTGVQRVQTRLDMEGRFDWGDVKLSPHYKAVDEDGVEVPFRELYRGKCSDHPHQQLILELSVELPSMKLCRFYLENIERKEIEQTAILENKLIRVEVQNNGSATIKDKRNGQRYPMVGLFSDQKDIGDEYTFAPVPDSLEKVYDDLKLKQDTNSECSAIQTVKLSGNLAVNNEDLPVSISWSLAPGEDKVQVDIRVENVAENHRLRWRMPLGFAPEACRVGHKIAEQMKPVMQKRQRKDGTWELPIHPADYYVATDNNQTGLALFSEFPFEYEVVDNSIAVTLIRSVGILSVSEKVLTRNPGAGPDTPTPEAQCLRTFDFRFAVKPYHKDQNLLPSAMDWRCRPLQGWIWGADPNDTGTANSILEISKGPIKIHSFKKSHRGNDLIIRLVNPTPSPASCSMKSEIFTNDLQPCDHLERPLNEEKTESINNSITLELPPWGLKSYII